MISTSKNKINRDNVRSHSAKAERGDPHKVCTSKLSKRELEDLYLALMDTNMELKRTVNAQQDNIKMLNTKVNRLMTAQRTARETSCCVPTKAIVLEQKDTISDLKRANDRMSDRIRILNMRLCSAKQFLKRCPSQGNARCYKCCMTGPSASLKNSTVSVIHSKRSVSEHKAASPSQEGGKDPASVRTVETETDEHDQENEPICKENKCRSLIEELKQKIIDLQEDSSKHHANYSGRISRLEAEMAALQAENERVKRERAATQQSLAQKGQREQQLAAKLRSADAQCNEIASQYLIEKAKVAELETRLKSADLASPAAGTADRRQHRPLVEERTDEQPSTSRMTSSPVEETPKEGEADCECAADKTSMDCKKSQSQEPRPLPARQVCCSSSYISLPQGNAASPAATAPSPAKSKHSDDSGYNDNPQSSVDDKALAKINKDLLKKITDLQEQLDRLRVASTTLRNEQMLSATEPKASTEASSDDSARQDKCGRYSRNVGRGKEKSVERSTKDGSPILRANEIWSKFDHVGTQQKEDKIQFVNSCETKSPDYRRASTVSVRSRAGSPVRPTDKEFTKDAFTLRRRSSSVKEALKQGECSKRQPSPVKTSYKETNRVLNIKLPASPDNIPDKESIKYSLGPRRSNSPEKDSIKDGSPVRRCNDKMSKELIDERSISNDEQNELVDKIENVKTIKPVQIKTNAGYTDISDGSFNPYRHDVIVPGDKLNAYSDIETRYDFQCDPKTQDRFTSDARRQTDFVRNVKTQDELKRDSKTKNDMQRELKLVNKLKRNIEPQKNLRRDVETQEDREAKIRDEFKRACKMQDVYDANVPADLSCGIKIKDDASGCVDDDVNSCRNKTVDVFENPQRDDRMPDESLREIGTDKEKKTKQMQANYDEDSDSTLIHSPVELCEQSVRLCSCPRGARRALTVFRSCSGTLRFRTSEVGDAFRRCRTCNASEDSVVPKNTTVVPVNTTSVPENTTAVPENTTAVPENTTAVPENMKAVPENTTAVPVTTTAVPENRPVVNNARMSDVSTAMRSPGSPLNPHRVSIAKCCVPSDDTDHEISHLSDLPPEHDGVKSPRDLRSPGEQRTTTTYTDTYTEPSTDLPTLSEGEMLVGSGRRRSPGEGKDEAVEAQSEIVSVSQKMEEALHSIGAELARCRELLQNQRAMEVNP